MAKLKDKVNEIVEIAKECPENLQAICFEILLRHQLELMMPKQDGKASTAAATESKSTEVDTLTTNPETSGSGQDDVAEADLHTKTKHFMKKYQVTVEHINNLFYKENGEIEPLFDDLKTTKMAEAQIRIALLQAFRNGIGTGDFQTTVEAVRTEAKNRKSYDSANFTGNFKNNSSGFDFDTFDKTVSVLRLSEVGKKQLAELIKELQ